MHVWHGFRLSFWTSRTGISLLNAGVINIQQNAMQCKFGSKTIRYLVNITR
jgi:hypothetical protein